MGEIKFEATGRELEQARQAWRKWTDAREPISGGEWQAGYILGLRAGAVSVGTETREPRERWSTIMFDRNGVTIVAIRVAADLNDNDAWTTGVAQLGQIWHTWVELLELMDDGIWWHMVQGDRGDE